MSFLRNLWMVGKIFAVCGGTWLACLWVLSYGYDHRWPMGLSAVASLAPVALLAAVVITIVEKPRR